MVLSLGGNATMSENNMFGGIPKEEGLKKKMIDKLLIPLFQKKWEKVNENLILFGDKFRTLKDEIYLYLLKTIDLLVQEHKMKPAPSEPQLMFVLPPIKLKPEYEIYKLIFGNTKYDKEKLERIRKLLKIENITFDKIKSQI